MFEIVVESFHILNYTCEKKLFRDQFGYRSVIEWDGTWSLRNMQQVFWEKDRVK